MSRSRTPLRGVLWALALLAVPASAEDIGPPLPDYPVDQVAARAWVIHGPLAQPNPENQGFINNPAFVETSAGMVIVDPGSSVQTGEMVLRMLKAQTDKPVVAVFNTHVHGDHWLGNQAIRAAYPAVKIYAHPRMLERVAAGAGERWVQTMHSLTGGRTAGTEPVGPDHALDDGDHITVGDTTFRVHHHATAHTDTDLMIEVPAQSLLFLGDNVFHQRTPRIDDGNVQGNIEALDIALALDAEHHVPGHGPSGDRAVTETFRRYLATLYGTVEQLYEAGMSDFEMKDAVVEALAEFQGWAGFADQIGRNISVTWLQVEEASF